MCIVYVDVFTELNWICSYPVHVIPDLSLL